MSRCVTGMSVTELILEILESEKVRNKQQEIRNKKNPPPTLAGGKFPGGPVQKANRAILPKYSMLESYLTKVLDALSQNLKCWLHRGANPLRFKLSSLMRTPTTHSLATVL